jgi:hypothetical protein
MRKVLTTFGFGPMAELLDVAMPTFARYAQRHGYDLFVPSGEQFAGMSRHPSWGKIPLILTLLNGGYDAALWLDADVVVLRDDRDILDDLPAGASVGMVVHHTEDGAVPNCGVWLARAEAAELLESLWPLNGFRRSSCWWEQAALIAALGGDPDATPVATPAGRAWAELPYEWNPHARDSRGVSGCRFFHATCFPDRRAAMIEAIST